MSLSLWGTKDSAPTGRLFEKILSKYGHKVIYRRYQVGSKSKYFDETTGQGKGGPSWEYSDEVVTVRHDRRYGLVYLKFGHAFISFSSLSISLSSCFCSQ